MGVVANELAREHGISPGSKLDGLTGSPSDKQKILKAEAERLIASPLRLSANLV